MTDMTNQSQMMPGAERPRAVLSQPFRILVVVALAVLCSIGVMRASSTGEAQDTPATAPADPGPTLGGSVVSVIDVPGYTYVEVRTAGGTTWAVAPGVEVHSGDTVSFSTSMPMRNFYSSTLDREFDVIYFVDHLVADGQATSIDSEAAAAHGRPGRLAAAAPVAQMARADGGVTVEEVYAHSNEMAGQPLRIRGQVVSFTPGVMNTNWIRIRDGSSTTDLVVSTDATVAPGDIILVEGRLLIGVDLGQGYVLPAVVEDAVVSIE